MIENELKALEGFRKIAVDFEKRGVDFYLEAAIRSKNILARKLFYSLAGEEITHLSRIEEIFSDLTIEHDRNLSKVFSHQSIESQLKDLFDKAEDRTIFIEDTNVEALEKAMRIEKEGYKMYEDLLRRSDDEIIINFLRKILKEESGHLEALMNVHMYLTKSGDWLGQDESKIWSWMNT